MVKLGIKEPVKIQNGIDIFNFNVDSKSQILASNLGLNTEGIVFCMVSSLTPEKNHATAIEALSNLKLTDAQLLVVGDGPLLKYLEDQASRLNIRDKVIFVGRREDVREIFSVVDIFLLPSLKEGLPIALLEAMACGKAVIASRVGENVNVVTDRINGMLVNPGDTSSLSEAMRLMIGRRDLIKQFGLQARKTVEKLFSSEIMTQNYCYLYNQLLAGT
jgi:glycosyltransferase involved in cell wall biosynthesis